MSKYSLKVKVKFMGVLTWSGFILLEWGVDVTFRYDKPYIPECKEKDLLFTPIYFGKVISFYCLYSVLDCLTE
jgi:hypothetical protein